MAVSKINSPARQTNSF